MTVCTGPNRWRKEVGLVFNIEINVEIVTGL